MTRPYSWYPLAASDPVPGEPVVVRSGGAHYQHVATAIGDAERVLRTIVDAQDAVSDAVDAIRDRTHAVADRIRTAHTRYTAAGDALVAYAARLDTAQTSSLDALHIAQTAQRTLDVSQDAVRRWTHLLDEATDAGEDTTTQQRALTAARADRAAADAALERARSMLAEAVADRDAAARTAMDLIDAGTSDGLHDGWWEDWGADVAQVVSTWAGNISAGLGVASLFLGWVPVLGQALAVGALVAAGAALLADVLLAVNRGDEGDWFNVAMGAIGFLSFGASRYLDKAVDAFRHAAPAVAARASQVGSRPFSALLRSPSSGRVTMPRAKPPLSGTTPPSGPWLEQVQAAWRQVTSSHGIDRLLALAGHGDLLQTSRSLRTQLREPAPGRLLVGMTLIVPIVEGAVLKAATTSLYVGDVAMTYTTVAKAGVDMLVAAAPSAERLQL